MTPRGLGRLGAWWLIAAGGAAGAVVMWLGWVRAGGYVLAAAFAGAALLRLLLPPGVAGGLQVRRRSVDVVTWGALAIVLAVAFTLVRL